MTQLPEDLTIPVQTFGYFLSPLKSSKPQLDARDRLDAAHKANDTAQVLDALHRVRLAYQRDVNGQHLSRSVNVTVVKAEALIAQLEARVGKRSAA